MTLRHIARKCTSKNLLKEKQPEILKNKEKLSFWSYTKKIEQVFTELKLKCFKCDAAVAETFVQGAELHPFNVDEVVETLNDKLNLNMALIKEEEVSK